jgi:hypothetical protein
MNSIAMAEVLERFPNTKWCKPSSKGYDEAQVALAAFTDTDISTALASLRRNMARSMVTVDEIIAEIRRLRRRSEFAERVQREGINPDEIERERREMRNAILLAPAEEVRAAVAYCRKVGSLDGQPLSPKREEWSAFTIGMVHAALERKGTP